ncbi:DUF3667 domain-containing protein [Lacihabitans sp. LS3-19]|uniref:DUF3667 domain-containing protein n=1 Tax=Lacihabitans sp. LS3-19 TaxID=2487335 RepID=UPI0020CDC914|nr:DUF3667 domain-containing protein [Lacihabitans sp. LS3-19]
MNCNKLIKSNFCPDCGQSAATHRFSLHHFFVHDLVHGILHLDKGFFFSIKELFTRPGHSIREFIEGKRAKHFNYVSLIIMIIAVGYFVGNISEIKLIDTTYYFSSNKELVTKFDKISKKYPKLFTIIKIPLLAFFTFLFFKKAKQNFTEHLILNIYKVCGELLIAIIFTLIAILFKSILPINYFFSIVGVLTFVYSIWYYFQYFSTYGYSKFSLLIRSVITTIILFLIIASINEFVIGVKEGFEN